MLRPPSMFTLAAAFGALLFAPSPSPAQTPDYAPGSINTVVRNIDVDFRENDFGALVELVVDECTGDNSVMFNGPYRRIANKAASTKANGMPNPIDGSPSVSLGDARLDYLVFKLTQIEGSGAKFAKITVGDVLAQTGVNLGGSSGTVVLSATLNLGTTTISVEDTTPADSQILDAGPAVGGVDAVMVIKNGTPKTADIVCDMNMWVLDDANDPEGFHYGVKDYVFSQNTVNSVVLFYAMGPSGAESLANVTNICGKFNPDGKTPLRNEDGSYIPPTSNSCPAGTVFQPGLACVGNAWTREEKSDGLIGNVVRFFGDPEQPANFTSCGPQAGYCDPTEPIPEPIGDGGTGSANSAPSGNACNKNRGLSGAPNINISSTLQENAGQWLKIGGNWIYVQF